MKERKRRCITIKFFDNDKIIEDSSKLKFSDFGDIESLILNYKEELDSCEISDSDLHAKEFTDLIRELETIKEEVLYISIGCAGKDMEQHLPSYLKKIAETQNVRAILIDGVFSKPIHTKTNTTFIEKFESLNEVIKVSEKTHQYKSSEQLNLNVQLFSCYVPDSTGKEFYEFLGKVISNVLDKKGKVFIANHTQAWSLEDIPDISELYNSIKSTHKNAESLQLYTQGGSGSVRYYLDKLIDIERDKGGKDKIFEPIKNEFSVCNSIKHLVDVDEFKPNYNPQLSKSNFN